MYNIEEGNLEQRNRTMTINELIQRLHECGDEKFRNSAVVRILDKEDHVLESNLNLLDVKDGVNSVDIHIPY